ncbi:uncharacterized protein BDZ83DRAFT_171557 [Colletotrichum acutatum]|uniref:Uncharacterized protein n=1 Tax=Glomerella acutata TaxID=27357 RepID=A0AAD8XJG6_GLOAC|nr:uncharacterized protein BDZ83DRAFT_171557 [Colletotrichum acutatum]KAK1728053.1 hypothetical protein BDZ83DRAFT_171557 [Colletotrichum acutatum]
MTAKGSWLKKKGSFFFSLTLRMDTTSLSLVPSVFLTRQSLVLTPRQSAHLVEWLLHPYRLSGPIAYRSGDFSSRFWYTLPASDIPPSGPRHDFLVLIQPFPLPKPAVCPPADSTVFSRMGRAVQVTLFAGGFPPKASPPSRTEARGRMTQGL